MSFLAISQGLDPCATHREINDPFRSTGYVIEPGDFTICDKNLKVGWYRFVSEVGGTLPDSKIDPGHCGTIAPIWMRGQHPSAADGIVDRVACVNFNGMLNGCLVVINIKVKNCNGFFVYHLQPPHGCAASYCAGM